MRARKLRNTPGDPARPGQEPAFECWTQLGTAPLPSEKVPGLRELSGGFGSPGGSGDLRTLWRRSSNRRCGFRGGSAPGTHLDGRTESRHAPPCARPEALSRCRGCHELQKHATSDPQHRGAVNTEAFQHQAISATARDVNEKLKPRRPGDEGEGPGTFRGDRRNG